MTGVRESKTERSEKSLKMVRQSDWRVSRINSFPAFQRNEGTHIPIVSPSLSNRTLSSRPAGRADACSAGQRSASLTKNRTIHADQNLGLALRGCEENQYRQFFIDGMEPGARAVGTQTSRSPVQLLDLLRQLEIAPARKSRSTSGLRDGAVADRRLLSLTPTIPRSSRARAEIRGSAGRFPPVAARSPGPSRSTASRQDSPEHQIGELRHQVAGLQVALRFVPLVNPVDHAE